MRRDAAYWARLRKDPRSSWAAGLAILAVLAAILAVIGLAVGGAQAASRANPLYWALLLPVAWWASGLMGFEPRHVRAMAPLTLLAPVVAAGCLGLALAAQADWRPWAAALAVSLATAVASRLSYRGSLLQREGPAR